jgi:Ni2+-binding GTPase involved in maturation of urease and hydrogenase
VNAEELGRLKRIEKKYNSSQRWIERCMKIFIEPDMEDKLKAFCGFTKVVCNEDAKLVLAAIKKMSTATPRLTWLVYDEGGLTNDMWVKLKAGKFRD